MTIKVKAAPGLAVPTEHNPHEYIGQEPAEVAADSLYYRRLLDDGDILNVKLRQHIRPRQSAF